MREAAPQKKKRKPGIPTGNAGEYFVMGETAEARVRCPAR